MAGGYEIIAYTDGGCRGNPGPGGWAFLVVDARSHQSLERCGGERETTNNRMEFMAAIQALRSLRRPGLSVLLHSDSKLLIQSASTWMRGWKARGWRRQEGELKNVDLLQALDEVMQRHRVRWQWVKGHAGNSGNERVDQLTNEAMDRLQGGLAPEWERRGTWQL